MVKTLEGSLKIGKVVQVFQVSEFSKSLKIIVLYLPLRYWSLEWAVLKLFSTNFFFFNHRILRASVFPKAHVLLSWLSTLEIYMVFQ